MTNNQYQYMILTGKYLPEEDISFNGVIFYFHQYIQNNTYYEDSNGYWFKNIYDSNGNWTNHENSDGYWETRNSKGNIIASGNYND